MATLQQRALVEAHRSALAKLRKVTSREIVREFRRIDRYDDRALEQFVARVVPRVEGAQYRAAQLRANYVARILKERVPEIARDRVTGSAVRNGADPADVYARPFHQLWTDLSNGKPFEEALAQATQRLGTIADTDVNLASRQTTAIVGQRFANRIGAWERVPDGGACPFCLLVSTQLYRTDDLQPIHVNCYCDVSPVAPEDVASWNDGDVAERYGAGSSGQKLADYLGADEVAAREPELVAAVREHGELGPTIGNAAHDYRNPSDVAADVG